MVAPKMERERDGRGRGGQRKQGNVRKKFLMDPRGWLLEKTQDLSLCSILAPPVANPSFRREAHKKGMMALGFF